MIRDPEKKMEEVFDKMTKQVKEVMAKHKLPDNPSLEVINRFRWPAKKIVKKMKKSHQETKDLLEYVINERR